MKLSRLSFVVAKFGLGLNIIGGRYLILIEEEFWLDLIVKMKLRRLNVTSGNFEF